MKKQNFNDNTTTSLNERDHLIDKLLAAPPPAVSKSFVDSTMRAVELIREIENDKLTDELLAKFRNFPDQTDTVMSRIAAEQRRTFSSFVYTSVLATLSACASIVTVLALPNSDSRLTTEESYFAEISRIENEIENISFLVMSEEIFDFTSRR